MHEKVREFFDSQKEKEAREKEKLLIDLGLYEKEYLEGSYYSAEYPFSEWDEEKGESRYYKKVAVEVTDEEFEAIKQSADASMSSNEKNRVANVFVYMAVCAFVFGFILGLVFGINEVRYYGRSSHYEWNFVVSLIYWGSAFAGGMMFLGFAEVIKLLEKIKNKK